MKKVGEFLFGVEALEWIEKQKEPGNYLLDRNIFSGMYEVYQMD